MIKPVKVDSNMLVGTPVLSCIVPILAAEADAADDQAFEDDLAEEEAEDAAAGTGRRTNLFDSDDEAKPAQEVQDGGRLASEAAPMQIDSPADEPVATGQMVSPVLAHRESLLLWLHWHSVQSQRLLDPLLQDPTADLFGDDDSD